MTEVDILDGATHRELLFDASGEWVRTKTEIRTTAVPQNIMDALNASAYAAYFPMRNYSSAGLSLNILRRKFVRRPSAAIM
ncbi:MAG: PepSY-like domain-containing protein [Bacteroidales bacterium]|jgi:hypothetical protein|nr:PepSY-like domain-containing protein [Bacteroidales bacterium]